MYVLYIKTCLKQPLKKKTKIGFQDLLSLNAGQKYCRMLQGEHSTILSTFIRLPFVFYSFDLSIFEWPLKTGFTVYRLYAFVLECCIFLVIKRMHASILKDNMLLSLTGCKLFFHKNVAFLCH